MNLKKKYLRLLMMYPYKFGRAVGFTKLTELHNKWMVDMINGEKDQTLQAHRGSYKTTCVSIALAIILILKPNIKTAFIRKNDTDSREIIKQTATILLHPLTALIVYELYGVDLSIEYTANKINTNLSNDPRGTSQLVGRGCGGTSTGQHYDLIFTDDIVTVADRTSEPSRESTKKFYQELQNIRNRGGRIFNTGTPWHKEDCFMLMPNISKYNCYETNLISDEELRQIKDSMLPSLFSANYELKHIAPEDVIFTNPQTGAENCMVEQGVMHLDCAYGGDDYTAWSIMVKKGDQYYLYGQMRRKHVEDCYPEIVEDYHRFMCGKLLNEDNADKGMVGKELRKQGLKVILYHEGMNKFLKIATYLRSIWKNLHFVKGTDETYLDQILEFCEDAAHDDAPDSAASLARFLYGKAAKPYQPLFM